MAAFISCCRGSGPWLDALAFKGKDAEFCDAIRFVSLRKRGWKTLGQMPSVSRHGMKL